ncbi:MAG TPA: hypothetical protein PKV27_05755, partial [Ilumatobacteraceae bacterium]|nr:hypothetical protein [Ilumatobacteraceae bacterium]
PALPDGAAPYVAALSKRLEGREHPPILTPEQEHCVASAVVAGIGLDALRAAQITPETISETPLPKLPASVTTPSNATEIANGIVDCGVGGKFAGLFASRELAGKPDSNTIQKIIDCIGTEVEASQARTIIATYFFNVHATGDNAEMTRAMVEDCGFETR